MKDKDDPMYDESITESRATVNKISARNVRSPVDFFLTWTCNQKDTLGVKKIREWLESDDALRHAIKPNDPWGDPNEECLTREPF